MFNRKIVKRNDGFTLVEILAVIVLISLIVLIAIPSVKSISVKSKRRLFETKVALAQEAVNLWAGKNTSCFYEENGCGILNSCQVKENNIRECKTTFNSLAQNNIINYDGNVNGTSYVVNPIDSSNMNDYEIFVFLNTENKVVTSELNKSSIRDPEIIDIISNGKNDMGEDDDKNNTTSTTSSVPDPVQFSTDSWATIAKAVRDGNTSVYNVGDTKEIEIDGTDFTARIANNSTPSECSTSGFSQSACGFVVEFVDIVEQIAMNDSDTNVGGWPASALRTYLNNDFKAKLPSDLQDVIVDTTVVSGYGSSDSSNFTSTDQIYLLSTREIWVDGDSNEVSSYDTAYTITRQLDYYESIRITTNSYTGAIKQYNGTNAWWWLRAVNSGYADRFFGVMGIGDWILSIAYDTSGGLAPAFRIG